MILHDGTRRVPAASSAERQPWAPWCRSRGLAPRGRCRGSCDSPSITRDRNEKASARLWYAHRLLSADWTSDPTKLHHSRLVVQGRAVKRRRGQLVLVPALMLQTASAGRRLESHEPLTTTIHGMNAMYIRCGSASSCSVSASRRTIRGTTHTATSTTLDLRRLNQGTLSSIVDIHSCNQRLSNRDQRPSPVMSLDSRETSKQRPWRPARAGSQQGHTTVPRIPCAWGAGSFPTRRCSGRRRPSTRCSTRPPR